MRDSDGQVVAFIDQIYHAVAQGHVQHQSRMPSHEDGPQRRQVHEPERHRHAHPQFPDHLAGMPGDLGFGIAHARQQILATLVEELALSSQRQPTRRSLQQPHTQPLLELGDEAGHHGFRHLERVGPADEAPGIDHRDEGLHLEKLVHGGLSRIQG